MLDQYLIEHCSPTLASIKTANLFSCSYAREEDLEEQVRSWNSRLEDKGITLMILRKTGKAALVYVCRIERLKKDLQKPGVAEFLRTYGYEHTDVKNALKKLHERITAQTEFPHEIGLFLSYPLGDVKGFIENAGHNSKCCGCWKVYVNECEAIRTFARYRKCKDVYQRLYRQGRSVLQLTVAA